MTRAEQAALKAYPKEEGKAYHSAFGTFEFDRNAPGRKGYQEGYQQAEKDLADAFQEKYAKELAKADALTAEDVKAIFNKVRDLQFQYCATDGCYQEVADWFNNKKQNG